MTGEHLDTLPPVETGTSEFDRQTYRTLTSEQLDTLPYGVIVLDREGIVVEYNETESRAVGLRKDRVLGWHFFKEIAPCSRVREFWGRYLAYVASERTSIEAFEFFFAFASGVQRVTLLFVRDRDTMDRVSIIVLRHHDMANAPRDESPSVRPSR